MVSSIAAGFTTRFADPRPLGARCEPFGGHLLATHSPDHAVGDTPAGCVGEEKAFANAKVWPSTTNHLSSHSAHRCAW